MEEKTQVSVLTDQQLTASTMTRSENVFINIYFGYVFGQIEWFEEGDLNKAYFFNWVKWLHSFLTSVLDWSLALDVLLPENPQYSFYRGLNMLWASQGRFWKI
jgi:hypothetical protein